MNVVDSVGIGGSGEVAVTGIQDIGARAVGYRRKAMSRLLTVMDSGLEAPGSIMSVLPKPTRETADDFSTPFSLS